MSAMIRTTTRRAAAALAFLAMGAAGLHAQIPSTSPIALGMADNFTALARGVNAPAWNPAGLGMPDNPAFSLVFLPVRARALVSPIGPSDLAMYDGERIPANTKEEWLQKIIDNGGESGTFAVDTREIAISISHLAFSLSTSVRGRVNMSPTFAELFLFGNAGRTGNAEDFTFGGTELDLAATSTAALSLGLPFNLSLGPLPDQHFAVGATVKYTVGHYFITSAGNSGSLSTSPLGIDLMFPFAVADTTGDFPDHGNGVGVDVGAAWNSGIFSAGAMIQNLINTFEWNIEDAVYYSGNVVWTADTAYTEFEEGAPFEQAPDEIRKHVEEQFQFDPVLRAGAAIQLLPFLTLTGDIRHRLGESLQVGTRNHVGVGARLTIIPFLPLRAGLATISGGYLVAGGASLNLGPIDLNAAVSYREEDLGSGAGFAVGLRIGM